jgi:hypothetical protein
MALSRLEFFENIWNTFVLPTICFASMLTNLLNINVLSKLKSVDRIYNYMYLKSITNTFYLLICFFAFLYKCGNFCELESNFLVRLYQFYLSLYASSCLAMFDLLIEIIISFNRYLTISNSKWFKNVHVNLVVYPCLLFSFIFYLPRLFFYQIKVSNSINSTLEFGYESEYYLELIERLEYFSSLSNWIETFIRSFLIILLIVFINVLSFLRYKHNIHNLILMESLKKSLNGKINMNKIFLILIFYF